MRIAEQLLTCHDCGHEWVRLVGLVNGGVTDDALEPVACPRCRRECDPRLDAEMPVAIGELAQVAA